MVGMLCGADGMLDDSTPGNPLGNALKVTDLPTALPLPYTLPFIGLLKLLELYFDLLIRPHKSSYLSHTSNKQSIVLTGTLLAEGGFRTAFD